MGVMNTGETLDEKAIVASAEKALSDIAAIRTEVSKVIFGQEKVVQNTLLATVNGADHPSPRRREVHSGVVLIRE